MVYGRVISSGCVKVIDEKNIALLGFPICSLDLAFLSGNSEPVVQR